ncbi:MAG: M-like protein [uncultured Sulfurovum sp.]|uniref:M-like protein n=1 Tax=uncultured Sulfurovum sp. TaxID=269237 RepID=A0A6S6TP98_9BACT|nr:MAG: M-like protein [uncultured Sulfurovum sp.]
MNSGKLVSGIAALAIYLSLIFLILYFYNIHQIKAKNYVEKNADRVTVTLVNSDKTVFNKSEKTSTAKTPVVPIIPLIPKKSEAKKTPPVKKSIPKKVIPKKTVPKKVIPKKVVPKKVIPKKVPPKKTVPKKVVPKKDVPKKVPAKVVPPKKKVPKKTAKDLFSSVKTKDVKRTPVKKVPKVPVEQPSSIKHSSSVTDRIKATHQSGRVSNANRDKGIENAYIAKVKRHMMNWNAVGAKGQQVTIVLTIYNSGKFRYTIAGNPGVMKNSLTQYLDTLNRIGLGRHKKSTPYSIKVPYTLR